MRTKTHPIALAIDATAYHEPRRIQRLRRADAELIRNSIAYVSAFAKDLTRNMSIGQAADSLNEHSHYLWQGVRVLRLSLCTPHDFWDSYGATELYLGLQCHPLSDLRVLCIRSPFSVLVLAAMLLHTPRLEVLDISPVRGPSSDARDVFEDPVGEELFRQGLPGAPYAFRLRRLAYRGDVNAAGAGAIFFCNLFEQSRATIEWLMLPPNAATPELLACLEQGNRVTTLLDADLFDEPESARQLLAALPRLRRIEIDVTNLLRAHQALIACKASLRHLALGWENTGERTGYFRLQTKGLNNLLDLWPQLTLRELRFQHYPFNETSNSMPSCPPLLMDGIRAACRQRHARLTHSGYTNLTDDYKV